MVEAALFLYPQEVSVESGSDVTLPCRAPTDLTAVRWSRPELGSDHYVFFYRDRRLYEEYQHPAYRGRVSLVDRGLEHADASVTLRRASFRDTGTYECVTVSSRGHRKRTSELHLKVSHSGLTAGQTDEGGDTRGHYGLVAPFVVVIVIGSLILWKYKNHVKKSSECPAADEAPELNQSSSAEPVPQ
ncbi:butyrophilin subfamily 1 member A1-like [Dicentrarchus labrax]|uniref:butyrophilin subfamily 1 member A1-like n=1 Tax=Dicentrarchus labrax TaxID=13489 RepID=UPI0021F56693|nr:butyrophilin subfamily 1 member A1-like [Dicentrarchus labrax]